MSKQDYYDILGVERTASSQEIRAAHRTNVRKYHPDTADDGRGDPQRFAQIQEAYEILSVADYRRRYDNKQAAERGETASPAKRRPPKSPCESCKKKVYSSQRILYLGRYLCKTCHDRKQARDINRPKLTGWAEFRWRLKLTRVWIQVHFATITIIFAGLGAGAARFVWINKQSHRPAQPAASSDSAEFNTDDPMTTTPVGEAHSDVPVASVDPSDRPAGK